MNSKISKEIDKYLDEKDNLFVKNYDSFEKQNSHDFDEYDKDDILEEKSDSCKEDLQFLLEDDYDDYDDFYDDNLDSDETNADEDNYDFYSNEETIITESGLVIKVNPNLNEHDIMNKYNVAKQTDNKELKEEAQMEMVEKLYSYINNIFTKKYSTYYKIKNDCIMDAIMEIFIAMDVYDPTKSSPSNYFRQYIIHGIQKTINDEINHTSVHYTTNINKIKKVIQKYESQNKKITIQDIRNETGCPEETIKNCLELMNNKEVFIANNTVIEEKTSKTFSSPEEIYLEKERSVAIKSALSMLDDNERKVILLRYGLIYVDDMKDKKKYSYNDIAKIMNINTDDVKRYARHATSKLKNNGKLNALVKTTLVNYIDQIDIPLNEKKDSASIIEEIQSSVIEFDETAIVDISDFFE